MSVRLLTAGLIGSLLFANPVTAQPSGNSSANWVTAGPVYTVARTGSTVYLGGQFNSIAPKSQQVGAFGVFLSSPARRACAPPAVSGTVNAIVADGLGGYFVGGRFDRVGGTDRQNLVRLTSGCVVDTAWSGMVRGQVNALALGGNGVLYVGGSFTEAGQQGGGTAARSNLAAFASSTGVLQAWNPGANGEVHALKTYYYFSGSTASINVFVGGSFTQLAGVSRQNLGAVDGGGVALSFTADANAPVYTVEVEPYYPSGAPTRVYAGGDFTTIGGATRNRIAAIVFATGVVEPTFDPGANGRVRALVMTGNTLAAATFYVGGEFTQIGGGAKNYAAALSPAGLALPFAPEPNGPVFTIAPDFNSPSAIYIGGRFTSAGGTTRLNAVRVNPTNGLATDWNPAFNGAVRALAPVFSSRIAAGGEFDAISAQRRDNLAAIDLDTGQLLSFNPNVNGAVNAIAIRSDVVYIGGDFTGVDGQTRTRLASFAAGTRALTNWNPAADGSVQALTASGATIFAAGDFANIGSSSPRGRVAAIDATTGAATSWTPPDFDATVNTLAVLDSFLYVGGLFTTAGGVPAPYLTRVSTSTGARDATWLPAPNGEVRAICAVTGVIYAGGVFTMMGTLPRANLAALDTTVGAATTWQPDPNGAVNALSCGAAVVYAGGAFTTVGAGTAQQTRPRLAELLPSAAGPTGTYATSFRARALGIVEATQHAFDGVLAGGNGTPYTDEEEPVARLAFFATNFVGAPGPPTTPSVVSFVANFTTGSVRIRWSPPPRGPRPTSYRIFAGSSPGGTNYASGLQVSGTQFDVNAPLGTAAYVRVHAANAYGVGAASEELAFVVSASCTGPPDPPQGLTVGVNGSEVTFNWVASSGEAVSSYRFEAGPTSGSSFFVASPGPTQTSLTATAPDGVFYARVRAVGPCGTSLPSSEVVLTVGSATPPPTSPLNFSASVSGSLVTVSWSAPAFGTAATYRLDAGSGFRGSDLASVTTNTTLLSFSNVPPGTYYLRVYAVGSWGTSSASEELILIVP